MLLMLSNHRGATLTEQLLSLLLGGIIITALYGFYRSELYHHMAQETKLATLEDARGALDIMIRDLKNAGSWGMGSAPSESAGNDDPDGDSDTLCNRVYTATANTIHVQMDLNGNGNCADTDPRENIRYELTGPTASCPGANIIRRNGDCLVANVTLPIPGRLFSYYDSAGADLGNTPPLEAIRRIRIAFAVQVNNPDPKISGNLSSALSTSVELRN
jgi:type II secretory pathway component PulJ